MSVHYFYNYKDELIKKLKERFGNELVQKKERERLQAQLDEAETLIREYFKANSVDLNELVTVSNGAISFTVEEPLRILLQIDKNFVEFNRLETSIEIRVGLYDEKVDFVNAEVECYVIPGEKKCHIKKVGKIHDGSHFDENTINYYVRKAFPHFLTHLK
jgi:hypothetical protein